MTNMSDTDIYIIELEVVNPEFINEQTFTYLVGAWQTGPRASGGQFNPTYVFAAPERHMRPFLRDIYDDVALFDQCIRIAYPYSQYDGLAEAQHSWTSPNYDQMSQRGNAVYVDGTYEGDDPYKGECALCHATVVRFAGTWEAWDASPVGDLVTRHPCDVAVMAVAP